MSELHEVCRTPPGQAVVTMQGGSRALYGFTAFPLENAPSGAAIYIFVRPSKNPLRRVTSYWVLLHIGETAGLRDSERERRERYEAARRMGATHMLIHFCGRDAETRRKIVRDLVRALAPPRNERLSRPAAA
jgi:hypothetical protein